MKLLVIGASGFLGKHLLAQARAARCLTFGTCFSARGTDLVRFDLARDSICDVVPESFYPKTDENTYAVICAVTRQIDHCFQNRQNTHKINVDGTLRLISDLRELGIHPVFISTSYVFDGSQTVPTEDAKPAPICEYGRHKAEVEIVLQHTVPESLILRLDKLVGTDPNEQHLFSEWWQLTNASQPIACIAGQLMSPTLVDDAARAILTACRLKLAGTYHINNPELWQRADLAHEFLRITNSNVEIISRPMSAFNFAEPRPAQTGLNSDRFRTITGLQYCNMRSAIQRFAERVQ